MPWRTDVHVDAQTGAKAEHGRGKITARWAADPPRIAVQRQAQRTAILLQWLDESLQGHFSREVLAHLGIEEHRGATIDEVERFDAVLSFALWLGRDAGDIFEIGEASPSWGRCAPAVRADGDLALGYDRAF
jgi:hypothetical protein